MSDQRTVRHELGATSLSELELESPSDLSSLATARAADRAGNADPPGSGRRRVRRVHGKDDRQRIVATDRLPWSAICHLEITAADGTRWVGSGWLAGERLVVTAGHCVFLHHNGGWASSIRVSAGRDAGVEPFGSQPAFRLLSVSAWTENASDAHDYGAVVLPPPNDGESALGARAGYFGFSSLSAGELAAGSLNLAGYPKDKTPAASLWWQAGSAESVGDDFLTYRIDTGEFQSGSPIWRKVGADRRVVGIHTAGGVSANRGVRISAGVFDDLFDWRAE